ncbi:16S rRNA (guanine(966)-N(2))-methyltransferase RsmD [Candidatus Omnitrophota bacterium]
MRIIAGEFRGRKIEQPPLETTRPTKDRIREAVFNVIAEKVPDSAVLDLYAGSGAYGLEALSRGAERAVFVENDGQCAKTVQENIQTLEVEDRTAVIQKDVEKYTELLGQNKEKFDLIFSDPPYNRGLVKKTLIIINHYDILNPSGMLVIEHHTAEGVPEAEGDVSIFKQKTYKDIAISIFHKK